MQQLKQGELSGLGTGATVWPAAHVLSKYLERRYPLHAGGMKGLKVMDLGSGTGVAGLAAALLGADSVVVTDQAQLHFLMDENVARADAAATATATTASTSVSGLPREQKTLRERVTVCTYDWGGEVEHFKDNLPFDVVLVSDCVLPKLYPIEPLVAALCDITKPLAQTTDEISLGVEKSSGIAASSNSGNVSEPVILMSYEHRTYPSFDPRVKFDELANAAGLVKRKIPLAEHDLLYRADDIELWEVRRCDESSSRGIESTNSVHGTIEGESKPNSKDVWTSADGWGDVQFRSFTRESGSEVPPPAAAVKQQMPHCEVRVGWQGPHELPLVNLALDEAGGRVSGDLWASALALVGYLHECYYLIPVTEVVDSTSLLVLPQSTAAVMPPTTPDVTEIDNRGGGSSGSSGISLNGKGLAGMRVLELGSGVGLAAVVAKTLGASHVVATDKADALSLLVANLDLNFGTSSGDASIATTAAVSGVAAVDYDWTQPPPSSLRPRPPDETSPSSCGDTAAGPWDMVLCADCCYASPSVQPLLKSLLAIVTPGHTQVTIMPSLRPKIISKKTLI